MSDYLSNLVTRSLPSVSPIKPRLASLFEPDSLSVSRLPYQPPNELETSRQVAGEIEPSRQVAREIERRSVVDTQPIAAASTEPPPRTEARVGQTQEGRSSRDQRNEPAGLSLDPTASHVSVDQPSVTGRPAATLSPTSDQHSLDAPPTARLVETRDRERTTETISKDTTWPRPEHNIRQIVDEPVASLPPYGAEDRVLNHQPSPVTTVIPLRHEAHVIKPAARMNTEPISTAERGPTIKVTIGRVDVRAIVQSAPVARPRPKQPRAALPLDEYLKQRSGGRR